jgi:hypothetical protein
LQSRRKLGWQPFGDSQLMAIFEGVNDAVNRKIHSEKQQSSAKCGASFRQAPQRSPCVVCSLHCGQQAAGRAGQVG